MAYYEEDDLQRFSDIAKHRPDLFEKFMAWYQACQEEGALSRREKALIGLAVAHALQCPYCIDAFSQSCLEAGSNMEQMTEAIHMASAIRGGADPGRQLITVVRKGTRELQQLPASTDAFVWLRLYQLEMDGLVPAGSRQPLWSA